MSSRNTEETDLAIILLRTSPMPIGLMPGGGQPDFSDFSDPDFGKINFHIGKIGKQFFANISLPDHFRAYVDS